MIDGWHELETRELRSKSKLSLSWVVQIILIVLLKREIALKYKKKQTSMLTFMWSTPKEVNTQNLFMMQYWNIAAFEMTTQRHLYFLTPPLHEAKVTAYLDFDGDISNSQVCLIQTAQKV